MMVCSPVVTGWRQNYLTIFRIEVFVLVQMAYFGQIEELRKTNVGEESSTASVVWADVHLSR